MGPGCPWGGSSGGTSLEEGEEGETEGQMDGRGAVKEAEWRRAT